MKRIRGMAWIVIAAALVFGMSSAASASLFPTLVSVTPIGGGQFAWLYDINLDQFQYVNTPAGCGGGNPGCNPAFLTLYDFYGLVPGSGVYTPTVLTVTGAVTYPLLGVTAGGTLPNDDPSVSNVSLALTGFAAPNELLGTLTVDSTISGQRVGQFTAQATLVATNSPSSNISTVPVPAPEPGTFALLGSGMMGMVTMVLRRRRSTGV